MAKPRPEKKREPAQPATRRVLPMELQIGDRLVDETGERRSRYGLIPPQAARMSMLVSGGWINLPPLRSGPGVRTSGSR
jgi:hypothetical protein